jgi:uncharacterized protein (DUF924 family)
VIAIADELLEFWFGADLDSPAAVAQRNELWFGGAAQTDREIRARFADLPDRAAAGALDGWLAAPRSALALVIALDQLPRNLFRGTTRGFAYDARAVEVASASLDAGFDRDLHPLEAGFFYMPFQHAERLDLQERSVALFEALRSSAPAALRPGLEEWAGYARRHRDVIARFGRFPHRNALLGRHSTAAESTYLESGGERFGSP